jgi:hypothetical protein
MIDPYYSLTGRKNRYSNASIIDAGLPTARNAFYSNRANKQAQEALDLQQSAFDAQKQNYEDQLRLTKDQMAYNEEQGKTSNLLGLGSLAVSGYPMIKDSEVVQGIKTAAGNIGTGVKNATLAGTDYLGLTETPKASGSQPASSLISQATPINTQTTGEIPSTGIIPKTTVNLNQGYATGEAATKLPDYVYDGGTADMMTTEGADTGGFLSSLSSNPYVLPALGAGAAVYGGKILQGAGNLIKDPAHTISDFGKGASENIQGFVRNPIGSIVEAGKDIFQDIGDTVSNFVDTVGDVVRDPLGAVTGGSHFCTAVAVNTHVDHETKMRLEYFRRYCREHHTEEAEHYFKHGGEIVRAIEESVPDKKAFFNELKFDLVLPVAKLVNDGKYDEAVTLYRNKYIDLMKRFMVELLPSFNEIGAI